MIHQSYPCPSCQTPMPDTAKKCTACGELSTLKARREAGEKMQRPACDKAIRLHEDK